MYRSRIRLKPEILQSCVPTAALGNPWQIQNKGARWGDKSSARNALHINKSAWFLYTRGKAMVLVPSIDIYQHAVTHADNCSRVFKARGSNKSANVTIKRRPSRIVLLVINKVISPYLFHVVSYINAHWYRKAAPAWSSRRGKHDEPSRMKQTGEQKSAREGEGLPPSVSRRQRWHGGRERWNNLRNHLLILYAQMFTNALLACWQRLQKLGWL